MLVLGNSATATTASQCTGNSATATKLQNAKNIMLSGAVSGNANFDGSENIIITTTQANIAVLTGIANGDLLEIDYPTGFTKENCVCISAMFQNINNPNKIWGLGNGGTFTTACFITGAMPSRVLLSTKIMVELRTVQMYNEQNPHVDNTTGDFNFKIVLMKIS